MSPRLSVGHTLQVHLGCACQWFEERIGSSACHRQGCSCGCGRGPRESSRPRARDGCHGSACLDRPRLSPRSPGPRKLLRPPSQMLPGVPCWAPRGAWWHLACWCHGWPRARHGVRAALSALPGRLGAGRVSGSHFTASLGTGPVGGAQRAKGAQGPGAGDRKARCFGNGRVVGDREPLSSGVSSPEEAGPSPPHPWLAETSSLEPSLSALVSLPACRGCAPHICVRVG